MGADYLLAGSREELERLRLQSLVWEPAARRLFEEIPVRRGWRCIDVGCGAAGVLRPLARLVGPEGTVLGADVDPKLLAGAEVFVAEHGLANVTLKQANIFTGELAEPELYDLLHLRFMLAPLGRNGELLAAALGLCRPGGVVVLQEPDARSWSLYPPSEPFDALRELILQAFAAGGGDFNAGRNTFALLRAAGMLDVQVRTAVEALPPAHPYLRVILQFAASLRPRIVDGGLASAETLDALIADVETAIGAGEAAGVTFTVTQVWGRKPAAGG